MTKGAELKNLYWKNADPRNTAALFRNVVFNYAHGTTVSEVAEKFL